MWIRILTILLVSFFAVACADDAATANMMENDLIAFNTEAALIRAQSRMDQVNVEATISAASTQVIEYNQLNQIWGATAIAMGPPTPGPRRSVDANPEGPLPIAMFNLNDGITRMVQTGVAAELDASGCFLRHTNFFNEGINTIYAVAQVLNVRPGTRVSVDWIAPTGALVEQTTWEATQTASGRCVALPLRSSETRLLPGNWTMQFYLNGSSEMMDPRSFTIIGG